MIPVLRPACSQLELDNVAAALTSNWWGMGPRCAEFETRIAERSGYKYAVTVNSATAALHLALLASGCVMGDEVIIPALTFISDALAVFYTHARPIFADVDPYTLCLDWRDVQSKITSRTRAIIPVAYGGYPLSVPPELPENISVIEDAAHNALGRHIGDMVIYSFHPVKQIATGDGGAILTNDKQRADRLSALRWCGIDRSTWQRNGSRYNWDYAIEDIGYKAHWNDLQAAIGLAQLARYDELLSWRTQLAKRYYDAFADTPNIVLPSWHRRHTWHLFAIQVAAEVRDELLDFLAERGVNAGVHYKPLTYYAPFKQPTPPVTERVWRQLISLPFYSDLTENDQDQVINAVLDFWRE